MKAIKILIGLVIFGHSVFGQGTTPPATQQSISPSWFRTNATDSNFYGRIGTNVWYRFPTWEKVNSIFGNYYSKTVSDARFLGIGATAVNSTLWSGLNYDNSAYVSTPDFGLIHDNVTGKIQPARDIEFRLFLGIPSGGETLQSVTDRGATTTENITAPRFIGLADVATLWGNSIADISGVNTNPTHVLGLDASGDGTVRKTTIAQLKTSLALNNVNNTSDANKPVSTAQQTALDLKANLASPALTGNPTAPTQTAGNNSTRIATTAYVDAADATNVKTSGNQTGIAGTKEWTGFQRFQQPVFVGITGGENTKFSANGFTLTSDGGTTNYNVLFPSFKAGTIALTSDIEVGTLTKNYVTATGNYVMDNTEYVVNCVNTITVSLPATVTQNRIFVIKNFGTGVVTVNVNGSAGNIDNVASVRIPAGGAITVQNATGSSDYSIIASNNSPNFVNTSMTTVQTSATLNTAYPNAIISTQVTAPNVGTGMKYEKINTTSGGTWIAWATTTI